VKVFDAQNETKATYRGKLLDALPASFSGQHLADRIALCSRPFWTLWLDGV